MEFERQVRTCSEALPAITAELRRARRYEHRLATVVMSAEASRPSKSNRTPDLALVGDVEENRSLLSTIADGAGLVARPLKALSSALSRRRRVADTDDPAVTASTQTTVLLADFLQEVLRETDILITAPEPLSYAVFLPETNREGAQQAITRFREGFHERAGIELRLGCAEFPSDGLTVDDLLRVAVLSWEGGGTMLSGEPRPLQSHG